MINSAKMYNVTQVARKIGAHPSDVRDAAALTDGVIHDDGEMTIPGSLIETIRAKVHQAALPDLPPLGIAIVPSGIMFKTPDVGLGDNSIAEQIAAKEIEIQQLKRLAPLEAHGSVIRKGERILVCMPHDDGEEALAAFRTITHVKKALEQAAAEEAAAKAAKAAEEEPAEEAKLAA